MLVVALIILGILSRTVIHFPNFTPIVAIALFAGVYLPKKQAVFVPVSFFVIVDMFRGFHSLILFTWGSMALIALCGLYFKKKKSVKNVFLASFISALLFYFVTNFGVWVVYNTYPKTMMGLLECYIVAIPYVRNTLISTLLYSFIMFGCYEYLANRIRNTRFAFVLS